MKNDLKEIQKSKLRAVINGLLNTEIALFEFEYTLMTDEKDKKACKSLIRDSKKAVEIVNGVQHIEILTSLFNTFLAKKETYFIALSRSIIKNVKKWDKSDKGFKEFLKLEEESRKEYDRKQEEAIKQREIIKKAKEDGKKVEMTLVDGKIKPIIVEENNN